MAHDADVVVVGSGPSGALAAATLVDAGHRVRLIDVGHDEDRYRSLVPDLPFSEIRRRDPGQRRYFLGDDLEGVPSEEVRVGAQLTPPRQFVTRDAERLLPVRGEAFEPMQSLALGGLGATWGAASFTYTPAELRRIGVPETDFKRHYDAVARRVGISGALEDDSSKNCFADLTDPLPPLEIDSVSRALWRRYQRRRDAFLERGLSLGRTPLAILSRDRGDRRANPYHDMDFWAESRRSVFRPRYLIEELEKRPNFSLHTGRLALGFECRGDAGVRVRCRVLHSGETELFSARRLVLCAGAINSARLALHSLARVNVPVPILCNPYRYIPCVCLPMLGRAADDRRHSLSQLVAIYRPPDAPDDVVSVQFYGYRSLLLFKLVKEIPLPAWAGLQIARILASSLIVAGLHHSDAPSATKTLRIGPAGADALPEIRFDYAASDDERVRRIERERAILGLLFRLSLVPFSRIDPGAASSIHYAGTLPVGAAGGAACGTTPEGRLLDTRSVYVADSSSWTHLPAKGLTFTLMANAVRVAEHVSRDLRGQA